jgi:predicted metal-dependent peptidase
MRNNLSIDEWNELSSGLEAFHNIFYRFWSVCRPIFSEDIKTAAVVFDKDGQCIEFLINEQFWYNNTPTQRLFIICHECLHLILNHGKRAKRLFAKSDTDRQKLNAAMDICVNESLVERYGFNRSDIDPANVYVWADKVAEALGVPVPTDRCFEYYYNLFKKAPDAPFMPSSSGGPPEVGETVDEHGSDDGEDADGSETLEGMASKMDAHERQILENVLRDERNTLQQDTAGSSRMQAGSDPLGHTYKLKLEEVKIKQKWETIITNWAKKRLVEVSEDTEQWTRTSRRFSMLTSDLSLPYDMESETFKLDKKMIDVWFFLDTSGSCIELAPRFFNAARSLPPKRFNIKLFCFDTKVYESDLISRKVRGGGGTSFDIIESYIIRHTVSNGGKYPDSVFVITDGAGNDVNPKHPKVWHWFLSEPYFSHIPEKSKVYNLWEFE